MDFIQLWCDDRALSKILCSTIPIPVHDHKVKVTDFEFFFCVKSLQCQFSLIDLNRVWYEWMQDSKMLQKGKACLRRAALSGDRSYCLSIRMFICSFVLPSVTLEEVRAKFYVKVSQVGYISPATHQKAFIFGS